MNARNTSALVSMTMVATIILIWSQATRAEMRVVEHAYELYANQLSMPRHDQAPVTIRRCPSCDARVLRVSGGTEYYLANADSAALSRRDFVDAVVAARDTGDMMLIYFTPGDGVISRMVFKDRSP